MARAREALVGFETLRVEGLLLQPEWLGRVARLEADAQSEDDYGVPKGLVLRDEIARFWRMAKAKWAEAATSADAGADRGVVASRFVVGLLRDCLGFASLVAIVPAIVGDRSYPLGQAALGGRVPVVVAPFGAGLDAPSTAFGEGLRRRTAFGLAQEYLNAAPEAQWGIASDGRTLRIVRDNASLTRPAWIEVDLARMFTEDAYADFAAFWLLAHETRFGRTDQPATECPLERWREAGRKEGVRVQEHLRERVEDALLALGSGFMAHPDNHALRAALSDGSLTREAFFQELLRLAYRLMFLLTVEERGLLHPPGTSDAVRELYARGYGIVRLRERSVRRAAHDRHGDAWEALKITFRGLVSGEPRLGLTALAGLFAPNQAPHLDAAKLDNAALLRAVFRLSWFPHAGCLVRVNWRDMGPEELGSVYESLLELVPEPSVATRSFRFAGESRGNARKTSGSYYTPDSLVQVLLDSALEPVVKDTLAAHPDRPAEALLELSIVDPAVGSGHFLLAAARRLAAHVARIRANATPSPVEYRHALRQVVGRCLYGVDQNPMAVELCKVALWMEAVEPGLPLTFLDAHIRHGNALIGATPGLMEKGIPDEAWEPIEGDDKAVARGLKQRNKREASGQTTMASLWTKPAVSEAEEVRRVVAALEAASDESAEALARKEAMWVGLLDSEAYAHQRFVADAWCAAFVWPKQAGPVAEAAPTTGLWKDIRDKRGHAPDLTVKTVRELAERYRFFHWHLAFPTVFAKGGFDVVLGNPPWDALRLAEREFFASSHLEIAEAATSAERKKRITCLAEEDPAAYHAYMRSLRFVEGINGFVVNSERFPLCGVGRVNLFALFAETARTLVRNTGCVGQILPAGIVADDSTKLFFQALVEGRELASLFHFENEARVFPGVHHAFRFVLLVIDRSQRSERAEVQFYCRSVRDLADLDRRFTLSAEEIALLNPATRTCPIFRTRRDASLTMAIYSRIPVLAKSDWRVKLKFPLDVGRESSAFSDEQRPGLLPLYEGKYFHQYDHRWVTKDGVDDRELTDVERRDPNCSIRPRYWYPTQKAQDRFVDSWRHQWALLWRDITGSEKQRTLIATVVPSLAVAHSAWLLFPGPEEIALAPALIANLNSFALDFFVRQKVGGTHLSAFIVEQLPLLAPRIYDLGTPFAPRTTLREWLLPRVLELTYTAWDIEPFARDIGYDGPPFRWDPARRFVLRCELDAAFFHLYGIARDDVDYILDTFPIVRKNDEKAHGEYRTKRVILEIFDSMAHAARTSVPYATRLDPPPADPRVAHPPRTT